MTDAAMLRICRIENLKSNAPMAIFKDKDNLLCIVCNSSETFPEENT